MSTTNITIALDEQLLKQGRDYAADNGTSLNALIRSLLKKEVGTQEESIEEFLEFASSIAGDSGGWKWNRDEIYEHLN